MGQKKRRKTKPSTSSRTRRLNASGRGASATPKSNQKFWHGTGVDKVAERISAEIREGEHKLVLSGEPAISTATVRSLGAPPLAGHETIAEHYYEAVYQRSGVVAAALLAAAGDDDGENSAKPQ